MSKHKYEGGFEEWWGNQYGEAVQFRDWQSCENLHTAKSWQKDGFLAGCDHVEKINDQKIASLINGAARDNEMINKLHRELEQQRFNNEHNLSIDQKIADEIKNLKQENKELKLEISLLKAQSQFIEKEVRLELERKV